VSGLLSGEGMDGITWMENILKNQSTANIMDVPVPATLLILGLGAVLLRKKR